MITNLIHSPDDGGWYYQQLRVKATITGFQEQQSRTSQVFASKGGAQMARSVNGIKWDKWK